MAERRVINIYPVFRGGFWVPYDGATKTHPIYRFWFYVVPAKNHVHLLYMIDFIGVIEEAAFTWIERVDAGWEAADEHELPFIPEYPQK